jgi:hypothetical protein
MNKRETVRKICKDASELTPKEHKVLNNLVDAAMNVAYPEGPDSTSEDNFTEVNRLAFKSAFEKILRHKKGGRQ